MAQFKELSAIPNTQVRNFRNDMYLVSEALRLIQKSGKPAFAAPAVGAADGLGVPVSTTRVLSSGVAGTMLANSSGLLMSTVRNLLLAWVLTLPAALVLSGLLFYTFRTLFSGA
jgi:PiT family inorganic phosphate transporter